MDYSFDVHAESEINRYWSRKRAQNGLSQTPSKRTLHTDDVSRVLLYARPDGLWNVTHDPIPDDGSDLYVCHGQTLTNAVRLCGNRAIHLYPPSDTDLRTEVAWNTRRANPDRWRYRPRATGQTSRTR